MRRFVSALLLFFLFPSFAYASDSYDRLIPLAKKYVGVPYQFGGSSEKGFDCSGFTRHVMSRLGVTLARTTAEQYKQGSEVKKEDLRVGDLVFFETYKKGRRMQVFILEIINLFTRAHPKALRSPH